MQLQSTETLRVVTGSAVTTDVVAEYEDKSPATGVMQGDVTVAITGATTTTVVTAPTSPYRRSIKNLAIHNKHATSSNVVTVQEYNTTTTVAYEHMKVTLAAGETLQWTQEDGWYVLDAAGGRKVAPSAGRLLARSLLTVSGNHTTGMSTSKILIKGVGGGGAGGGTTNVGGQVAAAGGGGAGGYVEKLFTVTPNTAYAFTCGAAGAGAEGALGGDGTDSTFVVAGVTVTAQNGTGAPVGTASAAVTAYPGGAGGTVSTNGDVNVAGQPGLPGVILLVAGNVGCSGTGGSGPLGQGGIGRATAGDGAAGTGYGAGGAGSLSAAATAETGGNGTAGCWIVEEYA